MNSPRLPPGPAVAHHDRADVRLARLVLDFHAFVIHAEIVGGDVEESGSRGVRNRLLVLSPHGRGTDVLRVLRRGRSLLGILNGPARLQVDAFRPVDMDEGLRHQQFTCCAIQRVAKTVAVEVHEDLSHLPLDVEIDQDVLIDPVVVPGIVRRLLVGPLRLSRVGIPREDRHRPLVVARPLIGIPGSGVPSAVIKKVELRDRSCTSPRSCRRLVFHSSPFQVSTDPGKPTSASGSGAVHPPDLLAGLHIIGRHKSRERRTRPR